MLNELNLEKENFFIRQIHLIPICNIQIIMQYWLCYQNLAAKLYTRRDARYWIKQNLSDLSCQRSKIHMNYHVYKQMLIFKYIQKKNNA